MGEFTNKIDALSDGDICADIEKSYRKAKESHSLDFRAIVNRRIQLGARTLVERGGKIPRVLYEASRIDEEVNDSLGNYHFVTHYRIKDAHRFPDPIQIKGDFSILGCLAFESTLAWKNVRETAVTQTSIFHLIAEGADLGWIYPQKTLGGFSAEDTQDEKLGQIWRLERLSEVARRIAGKDSNMIKSELPSSDELILSKIDGLPSKGLTIFNEAAVSKLGGKPKIRLGSIEIDYDAFSTIDPKVVIRQLEDARVDLKKIMSGNYNNDWKKKMLAGGTSRLHPFRDF